MSKIIPGLLLLVLFISCGKKESSIDLVKRGCTVKGALNYDPEALENNDNCIYPFQGPKNGSFEKDWDWGNDYSWATRSYYDNYESSAYAFRLANPAATEGSFCVKLELKNNICNRSLLYQKRINLFFTKELLFDYKYESSAQYEAAFEVEFTTASRTYKLFQTTEKSNAFSVKDQKIILPDLPMGDGSLTFIYKTDNPYSGIIYIDNVRTVPR